MDKHNEQYDWDDQYYGTGPTKPPKTRGGVLALMLILIIFLCGIVTVLGILNIRLFQELRVKQQEEELSISFTTESTQPGAEVPAEAAYVPEETAAVSFDSVVLQQSPQSIDNVPAEGAYSLQEIYTRNIPSVVSILCQDGYNGTRSTGTGVVLSSDG